MRITNDRRARSAGPGVWAGDARPFGTRRLLASRWRVTVALSAVAAGAVLAAPAVASASPLPSPITGHVYLDDNTAGANTIAAFDRHADGSLTPLPGSPFPAGGAGTGAGLASEGAVQSQTAAGSCWPPTRQRPGLGAARPAGRVAAPGERGVLRRRPAGERRGARQPGLRRQRRPGRQQLHRLPARAVGQPDAGARVNGARCLPPPSPVTCCSTAPAPSWSARGWAPRRSTASPWAGGRLTAAPGSPFTAQGLGPFGSQFRPTNPGQLFVSNAHNGTGLGTVSAFTDSRCRGARPDRELAGR